MDTPKSIPHPAPVNSGRFGISVALSGNGDVALVSAVFKAGSNDYQGWAYFFTRTGTTWSEGQEVTASHHVQYYWFGRSLALSNDGNTAAIVTENGGHTYIFKRSSGNWTEQQKLVSPDYTTGGSFSGKGVSLSSDGNTVAVGIIATSGMMPLGVYVFINENGWVEQQRIRSLDYPANDDFGSYLSLSGDGNKLLVSAIEHQTESEHGLHYTGAAYLFTTQSISAPPLYVDTPGVYKDGVFYLRNNNTPGTADATIYYGGDPSDLPIAGDWNGDGISTIGVYRSSEGVFYISDSNTTPNTRYIANFGNPGDAPLAGRWDADITRDGIGVYRNSNGILYLKRYMASGVDDFFAVFGNPGDKGIAGDWNGDGFDSVGVYRPSNQTWYLSNNNTPAGITFSDVAFVRDIGTGQPVTGDWDGDGISTIGQYYAGMSSGTFQICQNNSANTACTDFAFGPVGGKAITGYWNIPAQPQPVYGILQPAPPRPNQNSENGHGD